MSSSPPAVAGFCAATRLLPQDACTNTFDRSPVWGSSTSVWVQGSKIYDHSPYCRSSTCVYLHVNIQIQYPKTNTRPAAAAGGGAAHASGVSNVQSPTWNTVLPASLGACSLRVIFNAVFIAFHAEFFFDLLGDSKEAAEEGAALAGECGVDDPRSESLERPREKRDLNVRDADMWWKQPIDC